MAVARAATRSLLPSEFTILSDDCWGGQLYRQLGIPYTTPTVGLFVEPPDYLQFLGEFLKREKPEIEFYESDLGYPTAYVFGARVHFMHFKSQEEAKSKFYRRYERVCWDKILCKVDFGKPGYREVDVAKWNEISCQNSLALCSLETSAQYPHIHNGLVVREWTVDGAKVFNRSRCHFDICKWVRSGRIGCGPFFKIFNRLFLNPYYWESSSGKGAVSHDD